MSLLEPIQGEPAAVATVDHEKALVIADYHAGIERTFRRDGIEVDSRAKERREHLLGLLDDTGADRIVFLGDLGTHIGKPDSEELEELQDLDRDLPVPVTLVPGNHDGMIGDVLDITVTPSTGVVLGSVGFVHGHSWPGIDTLSGDVLAVGHEHPCVRLEDDVGGSRVERVWLRGSLDPEPFETYFGEAIPDIASDIILFPSFNELAGGTWVNVEGQEFLSPFLPQATPDANAYLVDGTRLGPYNRI